MRAWFRGSFAVAAIILICAFFDGPAPAQSAAGLTDCPDFRDYATNGYRMLASGPALEPGKAVTGTVNAQSPGNRWLFSGSSGAQIQITVTTPDTLPLVVNLTNGATPVTSSTDRQVNVKLPQDGVYTLTIRRADNTPTTQGSFQVTVAGNFGPASGTLNGYQLNKRDTTQPFNLDSATNLQSVTLSDIKVTLTTNVNAVTSIETGTFLTVTLTSGRTFKIASAVTQSVAIIDSDVFIVGGQSTKNAQFVLRDALQAGSVDVNELREFALQGGLTLKTPGFAGLSAVWASKTCNALQFTGKQILLTTDKLLDVRPVLDADQAMRVKIGNKYSIQTDFGGLNRKNPVPITEFNNMDAALTVLMRQDKRTVRLITDRPELTTNGLEGGVRFTFDKNQLISVDWQGMDTIEVLNSMLSLHVNDERKIVQRPWTAALGSVTIREQVITLVNAGSKAGQWVLYPASEDFVEIETPAGDPPSDTAVPAVGKGYVPSGANLVGADCWYGPFLDCQTSDTANPVNGNLYYTVTDLSVPNTFYPFAIRRRYNSHMAAVDGPFGRGWSMDYALDYAIKYTPQTVSRRISAAEQNPYPAGLDLSYQPLGVVTLITGTGTRHRFHLPSQADTYVSDTQLRWRLRRTPDGWILSQDGLISQMFDRVGRWKRTELNGQPLWSGEITDRTDHTVRRATLKDAYHHQFDLQYDQAGHITHIDQKAADGSIVATMEYHYQDGLLTGVTYPDGTGASYSYDPSGQLTSRFDLKAANFANANYQYNAARQLQMIYVPGGANQPLPYRTYTYDKDSVTETDVNGLVQKRTVQNNRVVRITRGDPDHGGQDLTYEYTGDAAGIVATVRQDKNNLSIQAVYDGQGTGHLVGMSFGGTNSRSEYNPDHLLTAYTTPTGQKYAWAYDDAGNVRQYTPPQGAPYTFTYNPQGLLQSVAGPVNLTYAYQDGLITGATGTYQWRVERDALGRITAFQIDDKHKLTYAYEDSKPGEAFVHNLTVTDYVGAKHVYVYNELGFLVDSQVIVGSSVVQRTSYAYDVFSRLTIVKRSVDGSNALETRYTYAADPGGLQVIETSSSGQNTTRHYDTAGNLISVSGPGVTLTYTYENSDVDRLIKVSHELNSNPMIFRYDQTGVLKSATDTVGEIWNLVPTSDGYRMNEVNQGISNGPILKWSMGANNLPREITFGYQSTSTDPLANRAASYTYDDQGRMASLTNALGQTTFKTTINGGQRTVTVTEPLSKDNPTGLTSVLSFDALDRLVKYTRGKTETTLEYRENTQDSTVTVSAAQTTSTGTARWSYQLDALGRVITWQGVDGLIQTFSYDQLGRLLKKQVGDLPEGMTNYTYNADNMLESKLDGLGRGYRYTYDPSKRLQVEVRIDKDSEGKSIRYVTNYTYDRVGNLASISSPTGRTTGFLYDGLNRLIRVTNSVGGIETYRWDVNTLTYTDGNGPANATTYRFNPLGVLLEARNALNVIVPGYDVTGNLLSVSNGDKSSTTTYSYAAPGLVNDIKEPEGSEWTFAYDAEGHLVTRVDPLDHPLQFGYDPLGQLADITSDKMSLLKIERGIRTATVTERGGSQQVYTLDTLGRTQTIKEPATSSPILELHYNTDKHGGITLSQGADQPIQYDLVQDDKGRPALRRSTQSQQTLYFYDPDGNIVEIQNRLSKADDPATAVTYTTRITYDAASQPTLFTDPTGRSESIIYDPAGNVLVLRDLHGRVYRYGYDAANRLSTLTSSTGKTIYYKYDASGNLLTISVGTPDRAIARFTYDKQNRLKTETYGLDPKLLPTQTPTPTIAGGAVLPTRTITPRSTPAGSTGSTGSTGNTGNNPALATPGGSNPAPDTITYSYEYDALGNVKKITGPDQDEQFTPNSVLDGGLWGLASVKLPNNTYKYAYAKDGSLTSAQSDGADALKLDFNATQFTIGKTPITANAGQLKGLDVLDLHYQFDNLGRVNMISNGNTQSTMEYDFLPAESSSLVRIKRPNGVVTEKRLNGSGQPVYVRHTLPTQTITYQYQYDANGNLIQARTVNKTETEQRVSVTVFSYDADSHLISERQIDEATGQVQFSLSMSYDDAGRRLAGRSLDNRQQQSVGQLQIEFEYYPSGLLKRRTVSQLGTSAGLLLPGILTLAASASFVYRKRRAAVALIAVTFLALALPVRASASASDEYLYWYDKAGNVQQVQKNGQTLYNYTYDARSRLLSVKDGKNGLLAAYTYDAFDRLATRRTGAGTVQYFYDGDHLIAEVDGGKTAVYAQLPDGQILFRQAAGGAAEWLLDDGLETVQQYTGDKSDILTTFSLDGLGNIRSGDEATYPVSYRGMMWDTPSQLYLEKGHAYDPATGLYLQPSRQGPDSFGNLTAYSDIPRTAPVRRTPHNLYTGLAQLASVQQLAQRISRLDMNSVLQDALPALPAPTNLMPAGIDQMVDRLRSDEQNAGQLALWLDQQSNHRFATVDTAQGRIVPHPFIERLPDDAAYTAAQRAFQPPSSHLEDYLGWDVSAQTLTPGSVDALLMGPIAGARGSEWYARPFLGDASAGASVPTPMTPSGVALPEPFLDLAARPLNQPQDNLGPMAALSALPLAPAEELIADARKAALPGLPNLPSGDGSTILTEVLSDSTWPLLAQRPALGALPPAPEFIRER